MASNSTSSGLGALLSSLDAPSLAVLRAASTFGHTFSLSGILAVDPALTPDETERVLRALLARRVLLRPDVRSPSGERHWGFVHPRMVERLRLGRDAAEARRAHGRAAAWLQSEGELDVTVVAVQWLASDTPDEAAPWCVEATRNALREGDHAAALGWAERSLTLTLDPETAAEQWLVQTEVHDARGSLEDAERAAMQAWKVAPRGSIAWFRGAAALAVLALRLLRPERFSALGPAIEEALRNPATLQASAGLANAVFPMVQSGQYGLARVVLARLEEILASGERLDPAFAPKVYAARAFYALFQDDPAGYLAESTRAAEAYETLSEPRITLVYWNNVGFAQTCLGAPRAAIDTLHGVMRRATAMGYPRLSLAAENNLGLALSLAGRHAEAIAVERGVIAAAEAQGDVHRAASARMYLAYALHLAGDAREAIDMVAPALAALSKQPGSRVFGLAIRSRAHLRLGQIDGALDDAEQAATVLRAVGQVDEGEGLARLALVEALVAHGAIDRAEASLEHARDRLLARARRIPTWEARRDFLEGVPEHARTMELKLPAPG